MNDSDVAYGSYVNAKGGLTKDGSTDTTGFIKVKPNTDYYTNRTINEVVGFYDNNKTIISRSLPNKVFTTPSNCYFVRITCKPVTTFIPTLMVCEGTVATPYEPYKESIAYINGNGELRSLPALR